MCPGDVRAGKLERRNLAVPLTQLRAVGPAEKTKEALADWEYWVKHGYQF